ncbi:protein of unknown function [Novosphingobium sp. CF614]|uniref:2-oxoadipate dioxygenase/decarboxylase family protein n=1 Tax=Novosphingobium sp. CF614 TaxID=1884364 RepID=UPI0008F423F2|nr:DUF1338 family protein [Novosphingobium sp. CF614]SFG52592.1 protein of unknown function [Novosphingobium sp. CF614]
MSYMHQKNVETLASQVLGRSRAEATLDMLSPMLPGQQETGGHVSRDEFAAALNLVLFADVLERVPAAAAYVADVRAGGERICFDHGALRTICMAEGGTGDLPRGELAFRRILEPLGYEVAAIYPLPALRMTGRAYCHRNFPETIPQFFVSELHVDQFDQAFGEAAMRVFSTSRDPLDSVSKAALDRFAGGETLSVEEAVHALKVIAGAFDRHHDLPPLADYETLKAQSGEAAWIATEGNAFNHATDRVPDVMALAERQKAQGRPIKDKVEISRNGRVRQTAFRAGMVERAFILPSGEEARLMVPGSFHEFISRDIDPANGRLDLTFDAGNATQIFSMTKAA